MSTPVNLGIVLVDIALLSLLFVVAIGVARMRSLFAIAILTGAYSLLSAMWFVTLDAADVAFTEAAVGAGISTVLMLGAMLLTARTAKADRKGSHWGPLAVVLITGAVLVYATIDMPVFGDPNSAPNSYVGAQYMARLAHDIDIPNAVTAVLASYRGFDTLGETGVVFVAGLAVALLLGFGERSLTAGRTRVPGAQPVATGPREGAKGDHHVILRVVSKVLIPLIALYALYVQFHGEYSAGGGFQAGVTMAVAIILYSLIFGINAALDAVPAVFARGLAAVGLIIYAGVGFWALVEGGLFLDYYALLAHAPVDGEVHGPNTHGQHIGIMLIEIGVLFAVSGSMVTIYYAFAGRAPEIRDEDW
jgi:multicomponent Na+:H+ antiporter subunit B